MAYTTINKSTDYFNTKLYTGNGTTQSITGVGFQPDMVWAKCRAGTVNHGLADAVRGATNQLRPNDNSAEFTGGFVSFNADGFSLNNNHNENNSSQPYASWNWKANGAGSANTSGSINSTVSVNQTAGFSIVKWTGNNGAGATVGHGLGSIPKIVLVKNSQQSGYDWVMYHASLGNTKRIWLNLTNAVSTNTSSWNNTTPSNSLFTLGSSGETNGSGEMIGYCFAEKKGYSKFGSYTGNGNANGTFVYTGFKPKFIITKRIDSASAWTLWDNKRVGYNPKSYRIEPDKNSAEYTGVAVYADQLSNGFKIRTGDTDTNASGGTYIYMAFGQSLVGTNGVTAKAR